MLETQIVNLTFNLSFDHNLCFRCPNGQCKPILNVYVSIDFQWCKGIFKSMGFDSCNCTLKIRESIGTPTPMLGVHLGMWGFIPSHSLALPGACNIILGLPSWPTTLQALALIMNPRLGLQQLPTIEIIM